MRRIAFAMILVATGPAAVSAAGDAPYGNTHSFAVYRNGEAIGTHVLAFRHEGGQQIVSTSIDFAVKAVGLTVYRYSHRGQEVWSGGAFQSIDAKTDDNGKQYTVQARRDGNQLEVKRQGADTLVNTFVSDQGLQPTGPVRETLPANLLPSTHWNVNQVRQSTLLNTQYGTPSRTRITPMGRETVKTSSGTIEATRYRYGGDITMDQWFDDRGRWVKASFKAFDGSAIEYILQE